MWGALLVYTMLRAVYIVCGAVCNVGVQCMFTMCGALCNVVCAVHIIYRIWRALCV